MTIRYIKLKNTIYYGKKRLYLLEFNKPKWNICLNFPLIKCSFIVLEIPNMQETKDLKTCFILFIDIQSFTFPDITHLNLSKMLPMGSVMSTLGNIYMHNLCKKLKIDVRHCDVYHDVSCTILLFNEIEKCTLQSFLHNLSLTFQKFIFALGRTQ